MRRHRALVLALAVLACGGCERGLVPDVRRFTEIRTSTRPADASRPNGDRVARAEVAIPRLGFVLLNAAMDHADRACPGAGAEPTAGIPTLEADRNYRSVEYGFRCIAGRTLPNDARMSEQDIMADRWPEPPAGTKSLTAWMGYGYPHLRPQGAFDILLGQQVARARAHCGDEPLVVERIESRTQAPLPKPGDGWSRRVHAVRLLYRCLTPTTKP